MLSILSSFIILKDSLAETGANSAPYVDNYNVVRNMGYNKAHMEIDLCTLQPDSFFRGDEFVDEYGVIFDPVPRLPAKLYAESGTDACWCVGTCKKTNHSKIHLDHEVCDFSGGVKISFSNPTDYIAVQVLNPFHEVSMVAYGENGVTLQESALRGSVGPTSLEVKVDGQVIMSVEIVSNGSWCIHKWIRFGLENIESTSPPTSAESIFLTPSTAKNTNQSNDDEMTLTPITAKTASYAPSAPSITKETSYVPTLFNNLSYEPSLSLSISKTSHVPTSNENSSSVSTTNGITYEPTFYYGSLFPPVAAKGTQRPATDERTLEPSSSEAVLYSPTISERTYAPGAYDSTREPNVDGSISDVPVAAKMTSIPSLNKITYEPSVKESISDEPTTKEISVSPSIRKRIHVDIKPKSCPNTFQFQDFSDEESFCAVILGTKNFFANKIDFSSVTLSGLSGKYPVKPVSYKFADVSSPFWLKEDMCDCRVRRRDGNLDMNLFFDPNEVAQIPEVANLSENGSVVLKLEGRTMFLGDEEEQGFGDYSDGLHVGDINGDGCKKGKVDDLFYGEDCVLVKK